MALPPLTREQAVEYLKAFWDWPTFATQSLKLRDLDGNLIDFKPYPAQMRLWRLRQRCESANNGTGYSRIVVLKGRRVMISMATAAQGWHGTAFTPGRHWAVFANSQRNTQEIFSYYDTFHRNYKPFGPEGCQLALPPLVSDTANMLEYANGAWIQCITGGSPKSVESARGMGLWGAHISEAPYIGNLDKLLTALTATIPKRPGTMLVVEGTANGEGDTFHHLVKLAMAGNSAWKLLFFGSHEHPVNRVKLDQSPESFRRSLTEEEHFMMERLGCDLEYLYWRRITIDADYKGDVNKFRQEHPTTVAEAFLTSGRKRFSIPAIERQPVQDEAPRGSLTAIRHGARHKLIFRPDHMGNGPLTIFQAPIAGKRYVMGGDPSKGIDVSARKGNSSDPDYSSLVVLDLDTGIQVATYRARETPMQFARSSADVGQYYNWAFFCPERNELGYIEELLRLDYPAQALYMAERDPGDLSGIDPHQIGWLTTGNAQGGSRTVLISALESALEDGEIQVVDPVVIDELRSFIVLPTGRAEAALGSHDDTVFALALAVIAKRFAPRVMRYHPTMGQEWARRENNLPATSATLRMSWDADNAVEPD